MARYLPMTMMRRAGPPPRPLPYLYATVAWFGDRVATVELDRVVAGSSPRLDVIVPSALVLLHPGDRVALVRYPQGYVVAGRIVRGPQ